MLLWVTGSRILHHYDVANGRGIAGDIALTVVLLVATLLPVLTVQALVPRVAMATDMARFVTVFVLGVAWLRLLTSWLKARPPRAPDEVLVIGAGPLGRHTGLENRLRAARSLRDRLPHARRRDGRPPRAEAPPRTRSRRRADARGRPQEARRRRGLHRGQRGRAPRRDAGGHPRLRALRHPVRAARERLPLHARRAPSSRGRQRRLRPLPRVAEQAGAADAQARSSTSWPRACALVAARRRCCIGVGDRDQAHVAGPDPLQARARRPARPAVPHAQVPLDGGERRGAQGRAPRAERADGPGLQDEAATRASPRVGRFIRKYSIDELPQLINVLRGEMAIVGPRPPVPAEVAKYEAWQRRRLSVRPGSPASGR